MKRIATIGVLAVLTLAGSSAWAQPGDRPAPGGPRERMRDGERPGDGQGEGRGERVDPEIFRMRLQRRLDDMRQGQAEIEAALKRLDAGEAPERVREDLERQVRERLGGAMRERVDERRREGPRGPGMRGPGGPLGGEPDGPRGMGGRPGGEPGAPPPVLDRERLMQLIQRHNPEFAEMLRQVERENPRVGERIMGRLEPQLRDLLVERDPEVQRTRVDMLRAGWDVLMEQRRLGEAMARGDSEADLEKPKAALLAAMSRRFDLQAKLNARDIERLERRLADLREESRRMSEGRDAFVRERFEALVQATRERVERGRGERRGAPGEDEMNPARPDGEPRWD